MICAASLTNELLTRYYTETEELLLLTLSAGVPRDQIELCGPETVYHPDRFAVSLEGGLKFKRNKNG